MTPPGRGTLPRAAVVVNATKSASVRLRRLVTREAERAGWGDILWLRTSADDPGQGAARKALASGVSLVLAAGGDGTVRAVAEAMRGSSVPMAVVPLGTGNLFAHNLAQGGATVPPVLSIAQAVRTAFNGHSRRIDVGVVEMRRGDSSREEHAFLVMAGIGIDAQMVANTRPELKKRLGVLAYVDGIARSLRDSRRIRLFSSIDGRQGRGSTVHSLLIGNCGYLPGNILLLPNAKLDDGRLDIVFFRPEGFFGWLRVSFALVWENALLRRTAAGRTRIARGGRVRGLRYEQGVRIAVQLERPDEIELDGDPFGEVVAFAVRVEPGALLVRVPDQSRVPSLATSRARRRGFRGASRAPR